jgi:SAM-dependent MidA family methyltransferase
MSLREVIAGEIRQRGPIPFSRYMELCLYHPQFGYYSHAREQFGKAGDFYTSSDVHAIFGRLLARQFDEMWRAMDSPPRLDLIELGPGRGLFSQDVLDWSHKKFPDFLHALHYTLVESSPALRQRLQQRFAERLVESPKCAVEGTGPRGAVSIISSLDEIAAPPENAIVFGNEFFDAFPVEVISSEGELRIGVEAGDFVEVFVPATAPELEFLDRYSVHPQAGERVEAQLAATNFLQLLARRFERGFAVFIDYGYTREELLAGRPKSTVRAFRQHSLSDNPYEAPGEQDITANVNFTALRDCALASGFDHACTLTQAQFLMGIGEANQFADAFEDVALPQELAKITLQLKHLVTPAGLGEVFQVLLLRKGVDKEKAARLSGLTFSRCG